MVFETEFSISIKIYSCLSWFIGVDFLRTLIHERIKLYIDIKHHRLPTGTLDLVPVLLKEDDFTCPLPSVEPIRPCYFLVSVENLRSFISCCKKDK